MEQESQLVEDSQRIFFPFKGNIEQVLSLGLEPNHIIILNKLLLKEPLPDHPKIKAWIQALERKGYIDKDFSCTEAGLEILVNLAEGKKEISKELKLIGAEEDFDKWWAAFPATDTFIHKGKRFQGSRSFKNSKDKCKALFIQILRKKKYTAEQLIKALETEIAQKKDKSYKENKNHMSFMSNTHAYLNKEVYEGYIEMTKQTTTPQAEEAAPETLSI